jgi:UDP-N-acetylglucosamine--N-acetylmuramyl-(pentapeptide) pyrophosphoryl-undecaprenol N-acetylglucosamine transferase
MKKKTVFIATGGTGGHVFPAQALAEELISRDTNCVFLIDTRGFQYLKKFSKLAQKGNDFHSKQKSFCISHTLYSKAFTGGILNKISALALVVMSTIYAIALIIKYRPSVTYGFGSYASIAPCIASNICRIPVILHQSDVIMGRANKLLVPIAQKVATGITNQCVAHKYRYKAVNVGMPLRKFVREEIEFYSDSLKMSQNNLLTKSCKIASSRDISFAKLSQESEKIDAVLSDCIEKKFQILIIGGSQASQIWDSVMLQALNLLDSTVLAKLHIIHQSHNTQLQRQYQAINVSCHVIPFIENMGKDIAISNVILSRAGASAIAECAFAQKNMLVVPYALAASNHQLQNAQFLDTALDYIEEKNLSAQLLFQYIMTAMELSDVMKTKAAKLSASLPRDAHKLLADLSDLY